MAEGVKVRKRRVPKKQLDNPEELHPTKDGVLRVTPDNAIMAQTMILNQIRDAIIRQENAHLQFSKSVVKMLGLLNEHKNNYIRKKCELEEAEEERILEEKVKAREEARAKKDG